MVIIFELISCFESSESRRKAQAREGERVCCNNNITAYSVRTCHTPHAENVVWAPVVERESFVDMRRRACAVLDVGRCRSDFVGAEWWRITNFHAVFWPTDRVLNGNFLWSRLCFSYTLSCNQRAQMLKQLQMGLRAFLLLASKIWTCICFLVKKQARAVSFASHFW